MSNGKFSEEVISPRLKRMIDESKDDPEGFWKEIAEDLNWFERWDKVYEEKGVGKFSWFKGGKTNLSYNCLDYHVEEGRGDNVALIFGTGERDVSRTLTYGQLLSKVKEFASTLRSFGVGKGDRVTIYMPLCPEAIIAMLACTRIGAIHSVVFAGFGAGALAEYEGKIVAAKQGNLIALAFHPELTDDTRIHEYFLKLCKDSR